MNAKDSWPGFISATTAFKSGKVVSSITADNYGGPVGPLVTKRKS